MPALENNSSLVSLCCQDTFREARTSRERVPSTIFSKDADMGHDSVAYDSKGSMATAKRAALLLSVAGDFQKQLSLLNDIQARPFRLSSRMGVMSQGG